MEWKSEFAIGIPRIDAQHRTIFEYLLALENSKAKKDPREIQHFFFRQFSDYLRYHFEVEETMLEAVRYPDLAGHCAGHVRLGDHISHLEERLHKAESAAELVEFFEEWFIRHVLGDDREYVAYLDQLTAAR